MKAVILAGGRGTRLTEETVSRPKPMVEVGGRPLLWHICRSYAIIKEFFANYFLHMSNVTFDLRENRMEVHQTMAEPWRITLVDTGLDTQTGGRLKRVAEYVADEDFCCTYGDGVANVDITELVAFHRAQRLLATVTSFLEKPHGDGNWINGGFFVLSPKVLDDIEGDETLFEQGPLGRLADSGQLAVFLHHGFWQPVDTLRELHLLEALWATGNAPWKVD
jgi:glucose-1-phosphate cytidylyltransferase